MRKYRKSKLSPSLYLEKKTISNIIGFTILAFAALLSVSFFTKAGVLLSLRDYFYDLFGIGVVFLPPLAIIISLPFLSIKSRFSKINTIAGGISTMLSIIGLANPISEDFSGVIGKSLWVITASILSPVGAGFVLFFTILISLVIAFNTSLDQALAAITGIIQKFKNILKPITKIFSSRPNFVTKSHQQDFLPPKKVEPPKKREKILDYGVTVVNEPGLGQIWEYPPLSLLNQSHGMSADRGNLKQNAQIIEKTLESFGIVAKVVEVNRGPTVTQYALEIPMGTRLAKILALQNDLALALATSSGNVRIEAPIPGKSLVGVEIPNLSPEFVSLKNILLGDALRSNKSKTAVGLGLDVTGNVIVTDIAKMPHVLIAGTTGSGKSVLLNALICTILFRASPQEVKLIIADPKRVELAEYNDIPHLLTPVIVEPDKILSALKWAMSEMDRRYKLFHEAQVRNIASYNEFSGFQALPYIIIVIDELHNLMEFAPVEVEDAVCRIAAMARATGIHLVIATQRPSVDVITGLIKANIPCRIAFNVSSMIDSRVIIDQPGAEKLLGRGDMLYVPPEASKAMRIQGVFVSDTETRNLINFLKRSGMAPEYTEEVTQIPVGKMSRMGDSQDDFFEEAVRTICQYDRASASLLQRRLRIGYARAARLLDELENAGIVGPGEGSKPRDVLVKNAEEYLQAQHAQS